MEWRRRQCPRRGAAIVAALCAITVSIGLAGCAGIHASRSGKAALPSSAPTLGPAASPAPERGPSFPSPKPDATADAATMAAAQDRLAHALVPPGAVSSATRPDGVASALAVSFWCQPMADATGYWTVPDVSSTEVVDYLKSHSPQGLTLAAVTGSNAAGDTNVEAKLVEYAASTDAQNGLVYEVTPVDSGAGIRADAFLVPPNATCATAPPGAAIGHWGG